MHRLSLRAPRLAPRASVASLFGLALLAAACGDDGAAADAAIDGTLPDGATTELDAGSTPTDAPSVCVPDEARWTSAIEPLVSDHCGQCHGESLNFGAPVHLTEYAPLLEGEVGARLVDHMATLVQTGMMPPPQLPRLTDVQARALVEWASCGAETVTEQQGLQASRSPWLAPETGPAGLRTIDLLASEYEVPTGRDTYRCFVFEVPVTEDRFIRRFEMVFDRTEVLHHLVLLRDTDLTAPDETDYDCISSMPAGSQYLYAWAPGQGAVQFPEGGLRVRPGERYVMQMHYNNGAGTTGIADSSGVRLYVDDTTGTEYGMLAIGPLAFQIPARGTATAGSYCTVREASTMIAGMPHMHDIGSSFLERVERGAGGRRESIITIENWDFRAQNFYSFPTELTPGDRLYTECTWTNPRSENVGTGPRTEDEMCFNFAYITPPPSARYCDEGEGPPSDVPYVAGSCASTPSGEPPLARATWRVGSPDALTGGTPPDGRWEIDHGEFIVNRVQTPVGTIDLTETFSLARGQLWTGGGEIHVDLDNHVFIQSNEGPSFSIPNHIGFGGTWTPGTSPAPVARTCPDTGSLSLEYQVTGDELTIGLGPVTDIPGAQLWIRWTFVRRP